MLLTILTGSGFVIIRGCENVQQGIEAKRLQSRTHVANPSPSPLPPKTTRCHNPDPSRYTPAHADQTDHAHHPSSLTYKDAGVNIAAGDEMVDQIKHLCQRTHSTRVLGKYGAVAGLFRLDFGEKLFARNYKDPVLIACTDGVGTKIKIAADLKKYDTVGIDLVAMNVNDLIVQGGEPLFFLDYLAVSRLEPAIAMQMVKGISDACMEAGCALLGGETAEMPAVYSPGDFDMAGFAVGVVDRSKILDPKDIEAGDSVIGLASHGLHSNGYAGARSRQKRAAFPLMNSFPNSNARWPRNCCGRRGSTSNRSASCWPSTG